MKIYVSEPSEHLEEFQVVDEISEADAVVIMPGGLSSLKDMLDAIIKDIPTYLFNDNHYYDQIISQLYNMTQKGVEKRAPFEYMQIESEFQNIIDDLKKKNETINKSM